jgi:uncharacterized protein
MGYKEIEIKVPVYSNERELYNIISRSSKIKKFNYQILKKSLDARQKKNIVWIYRIGITSDELKAGHEPKEESLNPEYKKREQKAIIIGSGPAGIFSAIYLSLAGFKVTIIEQGSKVEERKASIDDFEKTRNFNPANNYSFGEGGAGTFSDGKLTSRTKTINFERNFIYHHLIQAGAPGEIAYMTHPHLGSDNLFIITQKIRIKLQEIGCEYLFDTKFIGLTTHAEKVCSIETDKGVMEADFFILATGLASYETYRMLINKGIPYHLKNFALGFRAEHSQELINHAQWGLINIPGVKAAEYRLTAQCSDNTGVYSFCMCPGGIVVPSTAYKHTNIVNGMSFYNRSNKWANAAVVATVNLEKLLNRRIETLEAISWLESLESSFYNYSNGYDAPASRIADFLADRPTNKLPQSSYPFNLYEADFNELLPSKLIHPLKEGLTEFCRKMKGYESGIILGLESKTSSQLQVDRDPVSMNTIFENLYIVGEGSGWAGGIISSAADGLKAAQRITAK